MAEARSLKHDGGEFEGRKLERPVYSNDLMLCQSPSVIKNGIEHRCEYYLLLNFCSCSTVAKAIEALRVYKNLLSRA